MGCVKGLKKAAKSIRKQLNPHIMGFAGMMVEGLRTSISDGRITKDEARLIGRDAIKGVYGVGTAAANIAIDLAAEAIQKQNVHVDELAMDDMAEEEDPLA